MQADTKNFSKFVVVGLYVFLVFLNGILSQYAQSIPSGSSCPLLDGSLGVCKLSKTCKWLEEELMSMRMSTRDIYKIRCGFENSEEVACCRDSTVTTRKSQQACDLYRQERRPVLTFLILNGTLAALGEFPHMAALGYSTGVTNEDIDFKCGGSLISDRYILTAAHCAAKETPIIARLGTLNIKNPEANPAEYGQVLDVNIASITRHPDYKSIRFLHDIALVLLAEVVPFNRNLHPACLYTDLSDNLPNTELYVTGWGKINVDTEERSDFLLKTNLTAINLNQCNETFATQNLFTRKLPALNGGHFCAQDPKGLSDACQGDSGGPIQILDRGPSDRAMPIIVGVTSIGMSCGTVVPSIYTRVAFYLDWIESTVWPN